MASRSKEIADSVTAALNGLTLPVELPWRTPFAKTAVAPNIERDKDPAFGCYVGISGRSDLQGSERDRCGRQWTTQLNILLVRRFDQYDEDLEQPATLAEIDKCIENAEYIAQWLDTNKQLAGTNLTAIDQVTLVDDEWLRSQSMFLSQIAASYI